MNSIAQKLFLYEALPRIMRKLVQYVRYVFYSRFTILSGFCVCRRGQKPAIRNIFGIQIHCFICSAKQKATNLKSANQTENNNNNERRRKNNFHFGGMQ